MPERRCLRLASVAAKDRPEENYTMRLLEAIYPGTIAELHDDNSQPGMYDIKLSGALDAAVEVRRHLDGPLIGMFARANKLSSTRHELSRVWWFLQDVAEDLSGERSYPARLAFDPDELARVLARLEAKGIERIGYYEDWVDYSKFAPGALVALTDPDVGMLFKLLGNLANHAESLPASVGGWTFATAWGGVGTKTPGQMGAWLSELLASDELRGDRDKLARSGKPHRILVVPLNSTTGEGWATTHWVSDVVPIDPIELPEEMTGVIVTFPTATHVSFTASDGWRRHNVDVPWPVEGE